MYQSLYHQKTLIESEVYHCINKYHHPDPPMSRVIEFLTKALENGWMERSFMKVRLDHDSIGEVQVPQEAYWGAQTQRAAENFQISSLKLQPAFVRAQVILKRACAKANVELKQLDPKIGKAIVAACDEILEGKFSDQFIVDVYQAGAGTSQNMNANEVIANRAIEIMGGKLAGDLFQS